jgi:hypothetical protein
MTQTVVTNKGIVFAAGSPFATFAPVTRPAVGDSVILYNLGNGQQLAVPTLTFKLSDYTFLVPSFQFAGFNWKLDFNFNLLSFHLAGFNHHDIACQSGVLGHTNMMYGDDAMGSVNMGGGCVVSDTLGILYGGDLAYNFADGARGVGEGTCDDLTFECKQSGTTLEWWVHSGPDYSYGGGMSFWFKGVFLGAFSTPDGVPDQLADGGHGFIKL